MLNQNKGGIVAFAIEYNYVSLKQWIQIYKTQFSVKVGEEGIVAIVPKYYDMFL